VVAQRGQQKSESAKIGIMLLRVLCVRVSVIIPKEHFYKKISALPPIKPHAY
jgi:hypothetical protein